MLYLFRVGSCARWGRKDRLGKSARIGRETLHRPLFFLTLCPYLQSGKTIRFP